MIKTKSQHYNYGLEALPVIFHSQTEDFFTYLERDGIKFLEFWWDHMGLRLDEEQLRPFEGMDYEIREVPERKSTIVLVTMPPPRIYGELYLLGFVRTPQKRWPIRVPNTRVFALESALRDDSDTGTFFAEITPRGRLVRMGEGPQPHLDDFYQRVYDAVWKK